jgi:hypothetical protein
MTLLQYLQRHGIELQQQGVNLRIIWHQDPNQDLLTFIKTYKKELLAELALDSALWPAEALPTDTDALEEFTWFSEEERQVFFGCRAVLVEEGVELHRAERDAAAAILQHQRLSAKSPQPINGKAFLEELRQAFGIKVWLDRGQPRWKYPPGYKPKAWDLEFIKSHRAELVEALQEERTPEGRYS